MATVASPNAPTSSATRTHNPATARVAHLTTSLSARRGRSQTSAVTAAGVAHPRNGEQDVPVVLEHALLDVISGQEEAFTMAFAEASEITLSRR
jgi:hypothetical protein